MTRLHFVLFAIVAALSIAAQPACKSTPTKRPPPSQLAVVAVEIIVALKDDLDKACSPRTPATSIFIATNDKAVYHCVGSKLLNHANQVPALGASVVRVNAGQSVRWFSKTRFIVTEVNKHEGPGSSAPPTTVVPDNPFGAFPKDFRIEVISGRVPQLEGTVIQRYKANFNIEGLGLIDPDLICSM